MTLRRRSQWLRRGQAWLVTGGGFTGPSLYLVPETGGGRGRPGLRALRQRLLATLTDRAY